MRKLAILALILGVALSLRAPAFAGSAGATTAVACGSSSTALLALGDLGNGVPRHFLLICNNGPGLGYVAFGTSNAATVTNGMPLAPLECLPAMGSLISPNGVIAYPTQLDVACISDAANNAPTANMTALDW